MFFNLFGCPQKRFLSEESVFNSDGVQLEVTHHMRAVLVDWLVDVAEEFSVQLRTLHLSVVLLDTVLRLIPTPRAKFQLVGCACMCLASKMEDVQVCVVHISYLNKQAYYYVIFAAYSVDGAAGAVRQRLYS
jgi:Cyclin, N-terminal domain